MSIIAAKAAQQAQRVLPSASVATALRCSDNVPRISMRLLPLNRSCAARRCQCRRARAHGTTASRQRPFGAWLRAGTLLGETRQTCTDEEVAMNKPGTSIVVAFVALAGCSSEVQEVHEVTAPT